MMTSAMKIGVRFLSGKYISMQCQSLKVPLDLFALNRYRLRVRMKTKNVGNSIIILQGGDDVPFYDTDVTYCPFRQESYFMWAFGVLEPKCYGTVSVETGVSTLFVPKQPESHAIWMGNLLTLEDFKNKYEVDQVFYTEDIADTLSKAKPDKLLTLRGLNTDSNLYTKEANFDGISAFTVDNTSLFNEIADLRVVKSNAEIDVMKYVSRVASVAHSKVMRMARIGITEYQCEATFLHHCYACGGCRSVPYTCICASGKHTSILHYGHAGAPNYGVLKAGDMCLFDMGTSYLGYASDITCSFPVNGQFSKQQKLIYDAVLDANLAVIKECKPGVSWGDMHNLAIHILLQGLKQGKLIIGDIDEECIKTIGPIFQPHGVGHLIGLDVHDVGGYLPNNPQRLSGEGVNKLRTRRVLQEGMCLTVEPGCYFINSLLDKALADPKIAKLLNWDVVNTFRGFGGVRIEDNIYITDTSCVIMSNVPRTIKEIEDWISWRSDGVG